MDDDDDFLYGGTQKPEPSSSVPPSEPQPVSAEKTLASSNGVIANLEAEAASTSEPQDQTEEDIDEEDAVDLGEDDESEDDVEFIMDMPTRSLDFRSQTQPGRPQSTRVPSSSAAISVKPPAAPPQAFTTEYSPMERGGNNATPTKVPSTPQPTKPAAPAASTPLPPAAVTPAQAPPTKIEAAEQPKPVVDDGIDPSNLPPATAPPSHPHLNPDAVGTVDGRSILEVDLSTLADKAWRRPGSDISDWFNYGFDEISWEAYCYRRRDLGDLSSVLKTNVINFAGMAEDQLANLPPEVRTMVMTGANAVMSHGGPPNPGMMGPGVGVGMGGGMNPMMVQDMSGMNGMMGMDMQMQMQGAPGMMQEGGGHPHPHMQGPSAAPDHGHGQAMQMGAPDGFGQPGQGMMGNMNMGGDFNNMQQDMQQGPPQMYPGMEGSGSVTPNPAPQNPRGGSPAQYRGRGGAQPQGPRGHRGFPGGRTSQRVGAPVPVRPASPLPPGVPTGPRNQNKYKDRDKDAQAVDGLDYGGTNKDSGRMSVDEEKSSSRKRRISPGYEDVRGPKRR